MSKTCLHISFAIILTLFVVNLNANPKPKADNGIDIIINRVGPMVGSRMLGLRKNWKVNQVESGPKPGTGAGHWAMMPKGLFVCLFVFRSQDLLSRNVLLMFPN